MRAMVRACCFRPTPAMLANFGSEMIHPFTCYLFIASSFAISFWLYSRVGVNSETYFYLPIVTLIAFYTIYAMVTDKQTYQKRQLKQSILTATGKYIFWGIVLLTVIGIYYYHPFWYYENSQNTRRFFWHLFYAFALFGWPYFFLADRYRYCVSNVVVDHYVTTRAILRPLCRLQFAKFKQRLATRQSKRMFISAALRIHYIPLMAEQVYFGVQSLMSQLFAPSFTTVDPAGPPQSSIPAILFALTTIAWMVDSNNASIGYFWESRFTKTCFREIDPHPSHWVVTLACYYPFITFMNEYVANFPALPESFTPRLFESSGVNTAIDITMVVFLLLYMLGGSSLSFSFSNLSYKRIQTKGPYRFIRHPSIAFKIVFFTLAFYRFAPAYTGVWLYCYITWMGIYVTRGFVEERFLRRFPEYQAYMKQTRYRFIPGII